MKKMHTLNSAEKCVDVSNRLGIAAFSFKRIHFIHEICSYIKYLIMNVAFFHIKNDRGFTVL